MEDDARTRLNLQPLTSRCPDTGVVTLDQTPRRIQQTFDDLNYDDIFFLFRLVPGESTGHRWRPNRASRSSLRSANRTPTSLSLLLFPFLLRIT